MKKLLLLLALLCVPPAWGASVNSNLSGKLVITGTDTTAVAAQQFVAAGTVGYVTEATGSFASMWYTNVYMGGSFYGGYGQLFYWAYDNTQRPLITDLIMSLHYTTKTSTEVVATGQCLMIVDNSWVYLPYTFTSVGRSDGLANFTLTIG